jgi:hypothetical protein
MLRFRFPQFVFAAPANDDLTAGAKKAFSNRQPNA